MPRALSSAAKTAIFSQETAQVFLLLIDITHPSISPTLRFCNNRTEIVSGGNTYLAFPFQISLPEDREDRLPEVRISIDNVDRQIVQAIRSIQSAPTITLNVVMAATPNTVEAGPFAFTLKDVEYDALVVSGRLAFEDILNEPFPVGTFTPNDFPGLF